MGLVLRGVACYKILGRDRAGAGNRNLADNSRTALRSGRLRVRSLESLVTVLRFSLCRGLASRHLESQILGIQTLGNQTLGNQTLVSQVLENHRLESRGNRWFGLRRHGRSLASRDIARRMGGHRVEGHLLRDHRTIGGRTIEIICGRYYRRNFSYIKRSRRPVFIIGGYIPFGSRGYFTPLPPNLLGYLPPPPPGYVIGYYDGYCVVYDPVTFTILNVVDLLD
ncbi:MAG: hypothetical protein WAL95_13305 [Candidatus Acidiferrales bacterium]